MKKVLKSIAAFALAMICAVLVFTIGSALENRSTSQGFVSVADFGATPDDDLDDTKAFLDAVATGESVYIPAGEFIVSQSIAIKDLRVTGNGMTRSAIRGAMADKKTPILILEGCAHVEDLAVTFLEEELTRIKDREGDYVAIQTGSEGNPMTVGGAIRNILFRFVGTGIYSPKGQNTGAHGIIIDTIEFMQFSYRGIDMQTENRKGNTYSNMYIASLAHAINQEPSDSGFALEGSETGAVINQLNVEHTKIKRPIIFKNVKNLSVSSIHVEGVTISETNMGYAFVENSSGFIGGFTVLFTPIDFERGSVFCFGNAASPQTLKIGTIHVCGLNCPHIPIHGEREAGLTKNAARSFIMLDRKAGATGSYTVELDNYVYYTYVADVQEYEAFKCSTDKNLTIKMRKES